MLSLAVAASVTFPPKVAVGSADTAGEVIVTLGGVVSGTRETVALPLTMGSTTVVAVTVTVCGPAIDEGALY
jgi:hypothetical protein